MALRTSANAPKYPIASCALIVRPRRFPACSTVSLLAVFSVLLASRMIRFRRCSIRSSCFAILARTAFLGPESVIRSVFTFSACLSTCSISLSSAFACGSVRVRSSSPASHHASSPPQSAIRSAIASALGIFAGFSTFGPASGVRFGLRLRFLASGAAPPPPLPSSAPHLFPGLNPPAPVPQFSSNRALEPRREKFSTMRGYDEITPSRYAARSAVSILSNVGPSDTTIRPLSMSHLPSWMPASPSTLATMSPVNLAGALGAALRSPPSPLEPPPSPPHLFPGLKPPAPVPQFSSKRAFAPGRSPMLSIAPRRAMMSLRMSLMLPIVPFLPAFHAVTNPGSGNLPVSISACR